MKIIRKILFPVVTGAAALLLAGCSINDVSYSMKAYFAREASIEEETASTSIESRMFPVQVNNTSGEPLTKQGGEPVTVQAVYETATGGEPRINEKGIEETHPLGQIMTYQAGETVTDSAGNPETYAGGEAVTGFFGESVKDEDGNEVTRSAGEIVTHGADDIIYDENGKKMRYSGEPYTLAPGDYMYDTNGELVFTGITVLKDENGIAARDEEGDPRTSRIELVTDANGEPVTETGGEAATRVLEPLLPDQVIDPVIDEGTYYIRSIASEYVYFSAPQVLAANVRIPNDFKPTPTVRTDESGTDDASADTVDKNADNKSQDSTQDQKNDLQSYQPQAEDQPQDPERKINNLQLEVLGAQLPYFELRYDAEGYGYFVLQDTEQVLGFEGTPGNGTNILIQDMQKNVYPQFAYWDEPLYYLNDNQRWIIKKLDSGVYEIHSAADPDYCLTVDDKLGIHYANIMLWRYSDSEQQKFVIESDVPRVKNTLEEGTYYIRSGCSEWMMLSIGDYNYDDSRNIYLYHSDGLNGQMFTVSYDEYGLAVITHDGSTKVLSVKNSEAVNNQEVFQFEYDGDDWQKWILEPAPNENGYIIRSAENVSEVLNLMGGVTMQLQPIRLYWNDNTAAQIWFFETEPPTAPVTYEAMERFAQKYNSDTEYLILINTITNHVGIYIGYRNNWECLYYWDCVTGKPSTPTVLGQFTVLGRIPSFDGDTDSPELYTCYYATEFHPAYYFHSQVYYAGTKDMMDASMGVNASHGCVRLEIDNAQWIYENIPDGTKVVAF